MDTPKVVSDETSFHDKWKFDNFHMYTVVNPLPQDFVFKSTNEVGWDQLKRKAISDTREYTVTAGGSMRFPGPVASLYLDQMFKLKAQADKKFGLVIDWKFRDEAYEDLVVEQDDLINNYQAFPQYDKSLDQGATPAADAKDTSGGDGDAFKALKKK